MKRKNFARNKLRRRIKALANINKRLSEGFYDPYDDSKEAIDISKKSIALQEAEGAILQQRIGGDTMA